MRTPGLRQTRRTFLRDAATATALLGVQGVFAADASSPALKAAIIGHTGQGDYGHGMEGIFSNRKGIQVVAVADPDEKGRTATVKKVGAARGYADYRALLDTERPQLVSVAMRHADQHHSIILQCLRAGAHVYSEKPFVTAPKEADELLSVADKAGLRIGVAHTMRMAPLMVRLKQGLRSGLIGDLVEMRAFGKQDSRAGGEDMIVLGSHLFDLMRLFAGDPISCSARILQAGKPITLQDRHWVKDNNGYVAGDSVFAHFSFPAGVNATFTSTARLRETAGHWGIELLGSKGAVRVNCDISPNIFMRASTDWSARGKTDTWKPLEPSMVDAAPEHNAGPVGDWLEAIEQKREPECSGRNGAWAVEMVCGAYASALGQTPVSFPLARREHPLAVSV